MPEVRQDDPASDAARAVSTKERNKLAGQGKALPDGSFPIKTTDDLKNAIQAMGRAKNKAMAKAHIISRARALGAMKMLPDGWMTKMKVSTKKSGDSAALEAVCITCPEDGCERAFLHEDPLWDHAEAVHTFSDIERLVSETVREKYGQKGDYKNNVPYIYVWVNDMATDWVVFTVEKGSLSTMYKASYSVTDNEVTVGTPSEVRRRTVYEAVEGSKKKGEP